MAVTLIEEMALEENKLRKGVISTLVEESAYGRKVPWETTGALNVPVVYLSGIPSLQLRFINEAVSDQKAQWSQMVENLSILDSDIDIDPVLLANKNQIQRLDVAESQAKVKAMAYDLADLAINGSPVTNARQPRGFQYQLDGEARFNGQTVNASGSATEHELRVGTATDANFRLYLHRLNETIARVDNKPSAFLVNNQMLLTLWAALQQLKLFNQSSDQYEREILTYKGTPFVDMGWKSSGAIEGAFAAAGSQGDQVIGSDSEACTITNGAYAYTNQTPIYVVRFGPEHTVGLQQEPMQVKTFGQTDVSPHYFRTNVRWVIHPCAMFQRRAAARLVGGAVSQAPA